MPQINFVLIFVFGLAMVMFTLENTAATTVKFLPGVATTLPLAVLLLIVGGIGATAAWVFAVWTGVTRQIAASDQTQAQQVRIEELQQDVERYRTAMDAQMSLLPAAGESSSGVAEASCGRYLQPSSLRDPCDPGKGQRGQSRHPAASRRR